MKKTALALSLSFAASVVLAQHPTKPAMVPHGQNPHVAHGHGAHEGATATHGGILKEGKYLNLEMLMMKAGIALFAKGKNGNEVHPAEVMLTGTAKAGPYSAPIKFSVMGNHVMAEFEQKVPGPYELKIDAMRSGKQDSFTFKYEQGK